jgi:hypothetical protein
MWSIFIDIHVPDGMVDISARSEAWMDTTAFCDFAIFHTGHPIGIGS